MSGQQSRGAVGPRILGLPEDKAILPELEQRFTSRINKSNQRFKEAHNSVFNLNDDTRAKRTMKLDLPREETAQRPTEELTTTQKLTEQPDEKSTEKITKKL